MTLKEQYYNNPEDDVHAFDNIFNFIDFCYRNNYTPENSITEMDNEKIIIYKKGWPQKPQNGKLNIQTI
jgi:hypothetical protein